MSDFENDRNAYGIEELVESLHDTYERDRRAKLAWLDLEFRQIGYARYDKWESRWLRLKQRLQGKQVLSREEWNRIVDNQVEITKALVR